MNRLLLLITFFVGIINLSAQKFDDYFEDATLRLDYVFAGDNRSQQIFFHDSFKTPGWAGRRNHLSENFLRGNGQITVRDVESKQTIYMYSFSTLFQEWQVEEEAMRLKKAFENSYVVPFPKKTVEITISLTDTHAKVTSELTHVVNQQDILIHEITKNNYPYTYIQKSGDIQSCVDIAIISEGYSYNEMDKFHTDCQRVVQALFSHEPFSSMKSKFNVVAVDCPSSDSGPCIPRYGLWTNTSVNTHYDTFYTDRYLMTSDIWRVFDVLNGIPFEQIIVMVNSSEYGGGGIYNQINVVTSDHFTFKEVLVHEFGHGYGGLGDEYDYGDQVETMYPSDTEPWEPNLTTLVDFNSKWADLVPEGTPIPTPIRKFSGNHILPPQTLQKQLTQKVGVFEGGGYQSKGVYRPAQECRMKVNEVDDFCLVCSRHLINLTNFYTDSQKY